MNVGNTLRFVKRYQTTFINGKPMFCALPTLSFIMLQFQFIKTIPVFIYIQDVHYLYSNLPGGFIVPQKRAFISSFHWLRAEQFLALLSPSASLRQSSFFISTLKYEDRMIMKCRRPSAERLTLYRRNRRPRLLYHAEGRKSIVLKFDFKFYWVRNWILKSVPAIDLLSHASG